MRTQRPAGRDDCRSLSALHRLECAPDALRPYRFSLIPIGLSGYACVVAAQSEDETVRYVNGEVITFADVATRYADRYVDFERRKLVTPETRVEKIKFMQDSLDELTDEELMVQEAKAKKLVPDHEKVVKEILDLTQGGAKAGLLTLADQAKARKMREREESIEFLLDYFYDVRSPDVTPEQLWQAYQDHRQEYLQPARARMLSIVLIPSEAALINDVERALQPISSSWQSMSAIPRAGQGSQ